MPELKFPKFVRPSYAVAFGYCAMDSMYCGYRVYTSSPQFDIKSVNGSKDIRAKALIASGDTLLWQSEYNNI